MPNEFVWFDEEEDWHQNGEGNPDEAVPLCFMSNPSKIEQIHNDCRNCEFRGECLPDDD